MTRIPVSRGIAVLAVVFAAAAVPVTAAILPGQPAVAAAAVVRPADDSSPSPSDSPCPDGQVATPCPASSQDRQEVDAQRDQVEKDEQQARQDMAAAKGEATKCPPTSKQCMNDLTGDGHEQKEGMAKAEQQLDAVHPAPSDNAQTAVSGTCEEFAAELPAALTSGTDPADSDMKAVCEAMNP
ncbi:hypothetical protein [Streptomyces sp. NPDC091217]|uniref:hypothetical protein n=1 Tax=Streptomyces sp. NPDC091217 TaxID=3365975 RepID=UPI0038038FE8